MRVNPDRSSGMLAALERVSQEESSVLAQLSSGRKIQKPSDDPSELAALVDVQSSTSRAVQYLKNIAAMRSHMQAADSSLSSVITSIERALSLGVRGATGTLNDGDRESIAAELDGIREQILEVANSSSQGVFLFSGTSSTTKPFERSGSRVTYVGSEHANDVAIGDGVWIRANLDGTAVFGDNDTGAFATLSALATAIRGGEGISDAIDLLNTVRERISTARVVYGNALNQIDSSELIMNERKLQLTQQETEIAGADLAEAAVRLSGAITARNALLSTIGKANAVSLFDYLK